VKSQGAKCDGVSDDTVIIQKTIATCVATKIIFFDAGAYIHTSAFYIPSNAVILGEVKSVIMASGSFVGDAPNPKPVWSVGQKGQSGNVQIVDILFSNRGPVPGAITMQWNIESTCLGKSGFWSTHFRSGGAKGTNQSTSNSMKLTDAVKKPEWQGAFLQLHITPLASLYMKNTWLWASDHYLDYPDHSQIDIFNARTILGESQGPL
jgi:glucan 1,3-beta-glucosidase